MTSTIKVNNIQNQCGANIINESANTITIGASGDTIQLAAGASQTGFGRTGTVNWDTTAKTASFTAVSGTGYFVNTTSGAITVTLPASPSAGDIVSIADYAGTATTNNITIGRNSSKFEGQDSDGVLDENRDTVTVVYVDATQGWIPVNDNTASNIPPAYVTATGGNSVTTCGNFKYHKFTGPGTFCVSCAGNSGGSNKVQILIVAGGGAGGARYGGGGGAGGMVLTPCTGVPISASPFPIAVGSGGAGQPNPGGQRGLPGSNSTAISLTGVGGGGGRHASSSAPEQAGGSGGGTGQQGPCTAGQGTQPCQSGNSGTFGFGNDSGCGSSGAPQYGHAGGGGATTAGGNASPGGGANGGTGKDVTPLFPAPISGNSGILAGGGGGGSYTGPAGSGGNGGGGPSASPGNAGVTNTGGGGGGSTGNVQTAGGNGGSGLVIIRYKYQN